MTDSGADARAIEETAARPPVLPADGGDFAAEKVGDGWRASPNGSADADNGLDRRARMADWIEDVEELQRRIRARRGESPTINSADAVNEVREARIEQIVSAARRSKGK